MDGTRTPEEIMREMASIGKMERGTLSEVKRDSGSVYHNLQFWEDGRNRCTYVPEKDLPMVREAVDNCRRFRALAEEYAAAVEEATRRERLGEAPSGKKKRMPQRRCARTQSGT